MKSVCFISHSIPDYLGGVSLYHKNLIEYLKTKELNITWAYFGNEDKTYSKDNINYIEIKKNKFKIKGLENNSNTKEFLEQNYFDVVFTTGGDWTKSYSKPKGQKLIHIFHGTVHGFYKNHLKRFGIIKKTLFSPILFLSKRVEVPHKESDKIICVSNKVKEQVEGLYGKQDIQVIRTGVNLNEFKPRIRPPSSKNRLYGLYVGGGGYYTKGLDRAIDLSRELYKLNPDYRLIVIGPNKEEVKDLIKEDFIIFKENVPRDKMKYYYNTANIFLCMSRYEGGAPTLVVSEAMASGCLLVCSKDSEQEIIENNLNGLIINTFGIDSAKKILDVLDNKKEMIIKNSVNTIQSLSLEAWGEKYFKLLLSSD